jgi:hypothetical protein
VAESDLVAVAARNNAEWCDAFCRARGISGRFDDDAWTSAERTPSFYPDAVTLAPGVDAESVLARIDAGPGCSIKDSFGGLDLARNGFEVLFRAQWLLLERAAGASAAWSVVRSADELAAWEAAWGEPPEPPPFFRPALLGEDAVAILAHYENGRIVAGAIANRSANAIGLSNVFAVDGDLESAYAGAAAAAQEHLARMPIVGYESGEALDAARRAGFEPIGVLAVWAT